MIRFFRKIRHSLLSKGKFSQYLLYAVGEIVLVIVGILLALQINNWNEKRKLQESIVDTFTVLQDELKHNIDAANSTIDIGLGLDARFRQLFEGNPTIEEMRDIGPLIELGTFTQNLLNENLSKIIENEKEIPEAYQALIPHIKELQRRITSQRKWEELILEMVSEHRREYSKKLDWLHQRDSISFDKSVQFMLSDAIYKNQLKNWSRTMLNENFWDMSLTKTSSVFLLWKIQKIQNPEYAVAFEEFMHQNKMKPMKALACNGELLVANPTYNFRINSTLFNNRDETVHLDLINKAGKEMFTISVPPKDLYAGELELGANENYIFIRVNQEDRCDKIYAFEPNGFLVIN
ncbi:DUF6090 family protein [Flagellimonas sp.]|uniref:DUF6090 family protein n=1 Tax=Flagellimonas sp. TaxID=2058762 RepID=UPI003F4A6CB7